MGTIDNIYVLNYVVNRQLRKQGRFVLFVDLKAAFDSVHRRILTVTMKGRGIKEGISERVVELLRETMNRVRVEGETGGNFLTTKGVRELSIEPITFQSLNGRGGGTDEQG